MAKQINACIGGVIKTITQPYACVGGVVHKINEGYGCIGGVIKEFFSAGFTIFDYGENPYNIRTVTEYADNFASVNSDCLSISEYKCYSESARYPFTCDTMSELTSLDEYTYMKIVADSAFFSASHYTGFVFGASKGTVVARSKDFTIDDDTASIQTGYYTLTSTNKTNFDTYYASYGAPKIRTQWFYNTTTSDGEFYYSSYLDFNVYSISLVTSKG